MLLPCLCHGCAESRTYTHAYTFQTSYIASDLSAVRLMCSHRAAFGRLHWAVYILPLLPGSVSGARAHRCAKRFPNVRNALWSRCGFFFSDTHFGRMQMFTFSSFFLSLSSLPGKKRNETKRNATEWRFYVARRSHFRLKLCIHGVCLYTVRQSRKANPFVAVVVSTWISISTRRLD